MGAAKAAPAFNAFSTHPFYGVVNGIAADLRQVVPEPSHTQEES
jgi:hypothetical protein